MERFAKIIGLAGATNVVVLDPITGKLTWLNHNIPAGTTIQVGYLLGKYLPEYGTVVIYCFRINGILYDYGARVTVSAPSPGSTRTENLPTYIYDDIEEVYDVICFVGQGTLRTYVASCDVGNRDVGIRSEDVRAMNWFVRQDFYDVLGVSQSPERWTDTIGFGLIKA